MNDRTRKENLEPRNELPAELYISFVDGMLTDAAPIFFSAATVACGQLVSAIAAQSRVLTYGAAAQLFVAAARLCLLDLHSRSAPSATVEIARRQERNFSLGALASLSAVSLWTLLSFLVTGNGLAHIIGVATTTAYTFNLMSRSYAVYRGNNLQLAAGFGPMSLAMLVAGGWYPAAIIVGILPLVLFMKGHATRLRENFMAVVGAQQRATTLAARLDSALNNMSHGLCMIDRQGRIILANERFRSMFRLPDSEALAGEPMRAILRKLARSRQIGDTALSRIAHGMLRKSRRPDLVIPLETLDDRALEIAINTMSDDGAVLVIQDVTERRNAQREINRMALFDPVTELPNRRHFEEQLAFALHPERPLASSLTVMFLDLDDFKQVNDSLGHRTGDKLLMEIAHRLTAIIGPYDLVARWGGDEFVILHRDAPDKPDAPTVAKRIIDEVNRAVIIEGSEVIVGASVGSASAPQDGASPDALLSKADIALYAAKADGRRVWRAFEPAMDAKIQFRRLVELELRAAVATGAIDVYFQPIVSVATREIVSFEALARWNHAVRGRIPPVEFIPIVEEIGLMEELGAAVLRRACAACAKWPNGVSVSVNLSPTQFRSGNLEKTIVGALSAAGLAPERLDLEITESTLLEDRGDTRRTLGNLRARGLRISLDDFGTGYSSLSYLLSFPLDRIKIDRSFTMGLGIQERASVVVESVAAMSRRLGMCVLIEGVETERQMRMIGDLGTIAEAQGYLFSQAVPESAVAALLGQEIGEKAA